MKDMHAEVLELPRLDGEIPNRGYSKTQVEALKGRSFATIGREGVRVGRVVGSYAYRYEGRRVEYGLETEFKFSGGKETWKGSLNRVDIEVDGNAALLRGKLAERVNTELSQAHKIAPEVMLQAKQTVQQQALRVSQSQGMSF